MDWRRFSFDYRLRLDTLTPGLIRIEASREAALNLVLPPDWKTQLDQLNRVRAVHGTTALEGNPLSEAEVSRQMDLLASSSMSPTTPSRAQRQVQNAGRAQDWVRERFTPTAAPLRRSDILRMHELITEGSDETDNLPGRLRTHSVVVGTEAPGGVHRGAPPQDVCGLVDRFVEFVNSRPFMAQHPVVRALLAHFFLVTIHPFGDGNGRVSRLVEAGVLFQGEYNVFGFYGLSNYFYRHGDEYKRLLQQSRHTQPFDLNAFVAFGVEGFAAELKGINNFIKTKLNRVVYRATLARAFNQRAAQAPACHQPAGVRPPGLSSAGNGADRSLRRRTVTEDRVLGAAPSAVRHRGLQERHPSHVLPRIDKAGRHGIHQILGAGTGTDRRDRLRRDRPVLNQGRVPTASSRAWRVPGGAACRSWPCRASS